MGFFSRLFGGRLSDRSTGPSEAVTAILDEMKALARPSLRIVYGEGGESRLGGAPNSGAPWPRYDGEPLSLLAQLDLAEIRAAGGPDWLPGDGRLLFYHLINGGGWGDSPHDAGSFLVRHESGPAPAAAFPDDLGPKGRLAARPVIFVPQQSLPDEARLEHDTDDLSPADERRLTREIAALTAPSPLHQIGGYPRPIQYDSMELQCQLVTHGIDLHSKGADQSPEAERLRPGAADWRVLLQVDSDKKAGLMWADLGRLYFGIREQDARAGDFSKAWMVLQSY